MLGVAGMMVAARKYGKVRWLRGRCDEPENFKARVTSTVFRNHIVTGEHDECDGD